MVEAERVEPSRHGWASSPFALLELNVDATSRDIRRRLEEIEVEASLLTSTDARARVSRLAAARSLEDPRRRLEAELKTPWSNSEAYDPVLANEHDRMLRDFQTQPADPAIALELLSCIVDFANSPTLEGAISRRAASLGVEFRGAWLQQTLAQQFLAPLAVRIASEPDERLYGDLAGALERLSDTDASRVIAEAAASTVESLLANERGLSADATMRSIRAVEAFASRLSVSLADVARRLRIALVDHARAVAHAAAEGDDFLSAERILLELGRCDLPESERILVDEEVDAVAQVNAQQSMVERALAGASPLAGAPPLWTFNGCGVSLAGGHDHDSESSAYSSTYYLKVLWIPVLPLRRYRVRQAGDGLYQFLGRLPLRPQDWWHFAISLTAIVVAVVLLAANSDQTQTGGGSTSIGSRNSSAVATATPRSTLGGGGSGSTSAPPASGINAARDMAELRLADALDAGAAVPRDPETFGFHNAAARAESAFRELNSALRAVRERGGTLDSCESAIQSWASEAESYWSGLASATRFSDIDVELWNSTLDRYQSSYTSASDRAARLC